MVLLPNYHRAILDLRKIEDYCLNPDHPRGRHKAQVFRGALGINRADAEWLRSAILRAMRHNEAIEQICDSSGSRWCVDMLLARHDKRVVVRTIWIVRTSEDFPRFVTCWVL